MTQRTPIKQLSSLLSELKPALDPRAVVFHACAPDEEPDLGVLEPLATVWEPEGLSLVLTQRAAERAGLATGPVFRWITLTVHSSLEAVGLTAAVARALADEGIPANVIAGARHDHLLIPSHQAERALGVLRALSAAAAAQPD